MPIPKTIPAILAAILLVVIGFASSGLAVSSSSAANVRDSVPSVDTQIAGGELSASELQSSTTQPQYSVPAGLRGDDDDDD